jgi:transcriptional antiterminator Rof (Rho-off)
MDEVDDWMMLPWVERLANGDYTAVRAALWTRDGRRVGNSVQAGLLTEFEGEEKYLVVSDAGNMLTLNVNEMKALFHPPVVVMKKMLPAHLSALRVMEADNLLAAP